MVVLGGKELILRLTPSSRARAGTALGNKNCLAWSLTNILYRGKIINFSILVLRLFYKNLNVYKFLEHQNIEPTQTLYSWNLMLTDSINVNLLENCYKRFFIQYRIIFLKTQLASISFEVSNFLPPPLNPPFDFVFIFSPYNAFLGKRFFPKKPKNLKISPVYLFPP